MALIRGKRFLPAMNWLSDFQSQEWGISDTVVPMAEVSPVDQPYLIQVFNLAVALVALPAFLEIVLPQPANGRARLWTSLWAFRDNVGANDLTELQRQTPASPVVAGTLLVPLWLGGNNVPGGVFRPIIGGFSTITVTFPEQGIKPIVSNGNHGLVLRCEAVAAVGNVNITGSFVDYPDTAPVPLSLL